MNTAKKFENTKELHSSGNMIGLVPTLEAKPNLFKRILSAMFRHTDDIYEYERIEGLRPSRPPNSWEIHRSYWGRF